MALDKDLIKESLTEGDIKLILSQLGSDEPKKDNLGSLMFSTVCHNKTGGKHKLYYYEDSYSFHCYTHCSESFDIFDLVIRAKRAHGIELSFYEAVRFVAEVTGKRYSNNSTLKQAESDLVDDWEFINKHNRKKKVNPDLPVYDERVLEVFWDHQHESWINEGISTETMKKFEVSYYLRDDRIVLPHRNIKGELVGIRGRALLQGDIDDGRKYMPLKLENTVYRHPTLYNVYGLHMTKHAIKRLKKVALFEAEKSVLKCEEFYGDDNYSVAICSSNLSKYHVQLLLELGAEEFILCFDKEYEDHESKRAYIYAEKLLRHAKKIAPYAKCKIVWDEQGILDYKSSPCDHGKDVLEELMKSKYEIKTIEKDD